MFFCFYFFFFFKQKTAYEMRISDWRSDVCSSDLPLLPRPLRRSYARSHWTGGDRSHAPASLDRAGHSRAADSRDDGRMGAPGRDGNRRQDLWTETGDMRRTPADRKSTRLNSSH